PREFLGADNKDGIEAIVSDHEGHSLHKFINGNEPLHPIIDFDLPIEMLNAITPKVMRKEAYVFIQNAFRDVCLEINPKWDKKSITVASSSDENKISLHIFTTGMRLANITQVAVFTELVRKKLPAGLQEKTIIDNIANKRSFSLRMLGSPKYKKE